MNGCDYNHLIKGREHAVVTHGIIKARTHRDEYRRVLFSSVFCVHTQVISADDEPSEHANSFPDIRGA